MEHPPKQGLKRFVNIIFHFASPFVLMEHPPKQGLKLERSQIARRY